MLESGSTTREEQKPAAIPLVLAKAIGQLSLEEKRTLVNLLDWDVLLQLRDEDAAHIRRTGDPKIYVETTASGLGLEIETKHVLDFLAALPQLLAVQHVEILVQNEQGIKEYRCAAADLEDWLVHHPAAWKESAMMIELNSHTLVSGGAGCLSLALEGAPPSTRQKIAQAALRVCGYDHTFKRDHFSAIVWENQLEVSE